MSQEKAPANWREARRMRAWELKQQGWKQNKIAEALGVSEGAVSQWLKRAQLGGKEALRQRKGQGVKSRLSEEQLQQLPEILAKGASAYGYSDDTWTQPRVAVVIKLVLGVKYGWRQAGRILHKIGWSRQKPTKVARQRNPAAVAVFRQQTWVEAEKKP
jgi:transposase